MENKASEITKETLMNAVSKLETTAERFDQLANLSHKLVSKFERTEVGEKPQELIVKKQTNQPNIVDIFINVNNDLDNMLNQIGSNIEKVMCMIE